MWEAKNTVLNCIISPAKILFDSLKILPTNNLLFTSILFFLTLPLSFLTLTFTRLTHTRRTHIFHLQALAKLVSTRVESAHVLLESRHDAVSLFRTRSLFSLLLIFPLSLAAAVSAVHAATCRPATLKSAAVAIRLSWKRASVTAVVAYAVLLAYAPVPSVLTAAVFPSAAFLVPAIASAAEVYLMAVLGLGLVVSVAEERFGWDAIRVGSGLMKGRRLCGWILSALFVLVSDLINRRVEVLLDGVDAPAEKSPSFVAAATAAMGDWDMAVMVCSYGLVVLLSYVITAVFYCDGRRRHVIRELEHQHDAQDCVISL